MTSREISVFDAVSSDQIHIHSKLEHLPPSPYCKIFTVPCAQSLKRRRMLPEITFIEQGFVTQVIAVRKPFANLGECLYRDEAISREVLRKVESGARTIEAQWRRNIDAFPRIVDANIADRESKQRSKKVTHDASQQMAPCLRGNSLSMSATREPSVPHQQWRSTHLPLDI